MNLLRLTVRYGGSKAFFISDYIIRETCSRPKYLSKFLGHVYLEVLLAALTFASCNTLVLVASSGSFSVIRFFKLPQITKLRPENDDHAFALSSGLRRASGAATQYPSDWPKRFLRGS